MSIIKYTCTFLFNHLFHGDLGLHIESVLLTMGVEPNSNVQVVLLFKDTGQFEARFDLDRHILLAIQ